MEILRANAKLLLSLLGSAVVALVVAMVLAAISVSGVSSMNAAHVFLWIALAIFGISIAATAVVTCPNLSGGRSALLALLLVLILGCGWITRNKMAGWLDQKKKEQLGAERPPENPAPLKVPQPAQSKAQPDAQLSNPRKPYKQESKPTTPLPSPQSAAPQSGSITQNNSGGGINIQQGTTGPGSPIINSPITVGNIPKAISTADMAALKKYFLDARTKAKIQISADQFSGAVPLPDDFYDALKGGDWPMVDAGVNHMMVFSAPGKSFKGAIVTINGEPVADSQRVNVNESDAIFYIGNALQSLKIPHTLTRNKNQPEGLVSISFFGGFPD
jgi:hypothetical protein